MALDGSKAVHRLQDALVSAHHTYPEQRLGQLIFNALATAHPTILMEEFHSLLFYLDDTKLAAALEAYAVPSKEALRPAIPFSVPR